MANSYMSNLGTSFNTGPMGNGFTGVPTGGGESTSQSSSSQQSSSEPVQTAQSELSLLISQLAQQYGNNVMNWANSQVAPNTAVTNDVVGNYLGASQLALSGAQNASDDYNNIYRPEQAQLADLAGSYSSSARARVNAGAAAADSIAGSQAGINNSLSQLESYGVNPSAGSFGQLLASQKVAQGAAAAGAGTTASMNTQAAGRQLLGQSVAVGQQLPGVEANFLNSGAANLSGAANTQFGNTTTQATAYGAADPYLSTAQSMVAPATATSSSGTSSSASQSQQFQQANVPQNGPHYIASGGAIPDDEDTNALSPNNQTSGGHIDPNMSPSQGAITDDVNAHVNANEFVIPKDVALWVGQKQLQTMIAKSRAEMSAPGLAKPDQSGASPMDRGHAQFVSQSAQPQQGAIPA